VLDLLAGVLLAGHDICCPAPIRCALDLVNDRIFLVTLIALILLSVVLLAIAFS
jgi:hypothetical protein